MPLLDVRRHAPGFTEYRVTSDANKYGFLAFIVLLAQSTVSTVTQLGQGGTASQSCLRWSSGSLGLAMSALGAGEHIPCNCSSF